MLLVNKAQHNLTLKLLSLPLIKLNLLRSQSDEVRTYKTFFFTLKTCLVYCFAGVYNLKWFIIKPHFVFKILQENCSDLYMWELQELAQASVTIPVLLHNDLFSDQLIIDTKELTHGGPCAHSVTTMTVSDFAISVHSFSYKKSANWLNYLYIRTLKIT